MQKNLFSESLKKRRLEKGYSLREICELVNYDPSNWSKIERGRISPPSDKETLSIWAKFLGISKKSAEMQKFIDEANIAQGIIPQDIMKDKKTVNLLPAFFRTLRNQKPTKKEINNLIELIRNA